MIRSIIQELLKLEFSRISVSKQRNDKESMTCLTPKPSQSFFAYRIQSKQKKKKNLQIKSFLRKRWNGGLNEKRKEGFLTALATTINKDPTALIRKDDNELKVHEKTVRPAIKDLGQDINSPWLRYIRRFSKKKNRCYLPSKYWFA